MVGLILAESRDIARAHLAIKGGKWRKEFSNSDLTLLNALAYQVAITIDNARLLEHYVEKQRIQQELFIARDIQRRFLPSGPLAVRGFDVHGISAGCEETSGDYFDYIRAREGQVGLLVGDVAGHGVGAALFMATARALLRPLLLVDADPAAALGNLNAFLCDDMEAGRFMTLFYGYCSVPVFLVNALMQVSLHVEGDCAKLPPNLYREWKIWRT